MTRKPRTLLSRVFARTGFAPILSRAIAPSLATVCLFSGIALAQETPPTTEPTPAPEGTPAAPEGEMPPATEPAAAAPAPTPTTGVSQDLKSMVGDFWHFAKIARYDLASAAGQRILNSGAAPADVLVAFEQTAAERKDNLSQWIDRWQNIDEMKQVTAQVVEMMNAGRYTRRSNPDFINANIERLSTSDRGYANGIAALRDSGELAVPFLVQAMRDPSKTSRQAIYRRALRDLGRFSLNPLAAATEMRGDDALAMVCTSLGDLGYDVALPYLARVANDQAASPPAKKAALDAIQRISGRSGNAQSYPVGEMFYQLAEKFYYDTAAITSDPRNQNAYIWRWDATGGLLKTDVPPQIFNELMAMRTAEYAMKVGGAQGDALSLWLASNYKRETELPEGVVDATRGENQPDANYYGVSAGAQYLNSALARSLRDHNSPVALKVIRSLQDIAGQSNALPGGNGPLVDALSYPDRVVRIESAFALAGSLPQQRFTGQDRVVPLLAEALAQTGQSAVLVAAQSPEVLNALMEGLKAQGFRVAGGTNVDSVVAASQTLPSIDVVIISDEMNPSEIEQLIAPAAGQPAKLASAAKLVMVKTGATPYEPRKLNDPMLSTTQARDAAGLTPAIDEARTKAGSLPISADAATQYAMRSADLLSKLAISRGQVLDLSAAQPALLSALNDPRPEIVKQAGSVLGLFPTKDAQVGLFTIAGDEKTADEVKISLYKSLAMNAKFFGNLLGAGEVQVLTKVVSDAQNLQVRSAAAEAHGALNLPADQAKTLILQQSKI